MSEALIRVELAKGILLVIPMRVYVAGLKLGKRWRRKETLAKRATAAKRRIA